MNPPKDPKIDEPDKYPSIPPPVGLSKNKSKDATEDEIDRLLGPKEYRKCVYCSKWFNTNDDQIPIPCFHNAH